MDVEGWTKGRDDNLALVEAGAMPLPSPDLRGWFYVATRLSWVMGAVATRRIDPKALSARLSIAHQVTNEVRWVIDR